MKAGLRVCYNCDELFTPAHQCKKLFWIDSIDEEEESLEQEPNPNTDQPEISLQAIIGVTTPQNIRLQGKSEGNPVVSLVDSRSTHSFMNSKIVSQFNFQVEKREGLRVVVANGEQVRSEVQDNAKEFQCGLATMLSILIYRFSIYVAFIRF